MKRMMNRKETKEMKDMRNENHGRNEKHSGIRRGGIIAMAIALTLTLAATSVSYAWGGRNEFGGQRGGQTQNGQMGGWGMMASSASTANLAEVSEEDLVTVESISTDVFSKRDLEQTADTEDAETITVTDGGSVTLTKAGVYVFTGTASEYTITVEASKEDKVQIVLDSVTITNSDWPVIYVVSADKVFVTLAEGESSLSVTGSFREDGDENPDAVIYSKDDLTLNGTGTLNVTSAAGHGIVCKDDLKITGGTWNVVAGKHAFKANDSISICGGTYTIKAGKDGFHCGKSDGTKGSIYISDGSFTIQAGSDGIQGTTIVLIEGGTFVITSSEGIEGTSLVINDGDITISASDDGLNAATKSLGYEVAITVNGGSLNITMAQGDTDALDSNGNMYINGGTINISGQSSFDYDGVGEMTGGDVTVNGAKVTSIAGMNSFGGGFGGGFGGFGGGRGW